MEEYFDMIEKKVNKTEFNLNRYKEGKRILEIIIEIKEAIDELSDIYGNDLYVEVNGLDNMDIDVNEVAIYSSSTIDNSVIDSNKAAEIFINKYREMQYRLDLNHTVYSDISMISYSDSVFLKYEKYMEGILRLWRAKYLDDVSELFPLISFHNERMNFIKTITSDDIYQDVLRIKPKAAAWDEDSYYVRKKTDDEEMSSVLVHFNDFINVVDENGLDVYYNHIPPSEDVPFDNIIKCQKEGAIEQSLEIVYSKPLSYRPKRLVK